MARHYQRLSYNRHYASTPLLPEQQRRVESLWARLVARAIVADNPALFSPFDCASTPTGPLVR